MKPRKTASGKREAVLRRNLTPEEYKALSVPGSATPGRQPEKRKPGRPKPLPLNFLLGCSQDMLGNFELARLNEIADLRKELHAILDRTIDQMAQAALASWFKEQDRNSLKHAIENEETAEEWAHRMIRDGQRSESELIPLPTLEPGAAHLAAAIRYQERNIAEGKCRYCPEPICRESVDMCTEHLAKSRSRARSKKALSQPGSREYLYAGETPSTHGRQPGTLASLEMNREKKTRALLAELGIAPESAAVSLKAAKEALLRVMPDSKAKALSPADLFQAAVIPSRTTGNKALREMLSAGKIRRIGKPRPGHPFRYFKNPCF
ncbi:MAG TPA: hypothetical protein VGR55_00920 [Candidatus Acidoferrum sp.]|nr:hypothetical protein [Candidatus Acidoferrum sp.]